MGQATSARRAIVTIGPLVILLALAIIALLAWKTSVQFDAISASNMPFADKARSKVLTTNVITALVFFALSGGVGALAYFLARKSDRAASVGMAIPLLLGVGLLGYQAFNYASGAGKPAQTAAPTSPQNSTSTTPNNPTQPDAGLSRMSEQLRRQNELAKRPSPQPLPPPPISAPGVATAPAATPPLPAPKPAELSPEQRQANLKADAVVDRFTKELQGEIDALAALARPWLQEFAKAPKHDMRVLKARLEQTETLRAACDSLLPKLRNTREELVKQLRADGLAEADANLRAGAFESTFSGFRRSMAVDTLLRIIPDAREETTLLRDAFSKWKSAPDGSVDTKDTNLRFKLHPLRFRVEVEAKRGDDLVRQLTNPM